MVTITAHQSERIHIVKGTLTGVVDATVIPYDKNFTVQGKKVDGF